MTGNRNHAKAFERDDGWFGTRFNIDFAEKSLEALLAMPGGVWTFRRSVAKAAWAVLCCPSARPATLRVAMRGRGDYNTHKKMSRLQGALLATPAAAGE